MTQTRLMSFNLKNDESLLSSNHSWEVRKRFVANLIELTQPDIIGVQECTDEMKDALTPLVPGYASVGTPRYGLRKHKANERTEIFYRSDRFTCLASRTFWLSNQPDKPGSQFWFSLFPRTCTFAQLQNKETHEVLHVFNTHLDHLFSFVRKKEVAVLASFIEQTSQQETTIVMGDMNTTDRSQALHLLAHNSTVPLKSTYLRAPKSTIHLSSGKSPLRKSPIDYIFVSSSVHVVETRVITTNFNGLYPSDHYPVLCVIEK